METLITGQIDMLSQSFLDQLGSRTDVILSSEEELPPFSGRHITQYHQSIRDNHFLNLFSSYSFDAVIYFLSRPENMAKDSFELENLERVLDMCAQKPIKKVMVVSSSYIYRETENHTPKEEGVSPSDGAVIHLSGIEKLCRTYRETYHVPVTILHTACLYGDEESVSYVGSSVKKVVEGKQVVLDGRPDQVVEFLSLTDLGNLLERMLLEPPKKIPVMNVPGATRLSLQQFADGLKQQKPGVSIRFTGKALRAGPPVRSQLVLDEFKWQPQLELRGEVERLFEKMNHTYSLERHSLFHKVKEFYRTHSSILIGLELIIGFLLMEFLIDFSGTTVQFRVIDFRLLYVVLFASVHGPQVGLIAAAIASASTYASYMALGMDWRVLFYNVDNWIPFAGYVITGWVLGYVHDRHRKDMEVAKEEAADLTKREVRLNELYLRSLERKAAYEKQIISYDDSFGKVYRFLNKLEQAASSLYFQKALEEMEDFLDNQRISFYVTEKKTGNAYRFVCSSQVVNRSPEKMHLDDYPELRNELDQGGVWINKSQIRGYPDYALSIYHGEELSIMVTIQEATFEQMSFAFENLFKMTGQFVSTTLLHKWEADEQTLAAPLTERLKEADLSKNAGKNEAADKRKEGRLHLVEMPQKGLN